MEIKITEPFVVLNRSRNKLIIGFLGERLSRVETLNSHYKIYNRNGDGEAENQYICLHKNYRAAVDIATGKFIHLQEMNDGKPVIKPHIQFFGFAWVVSAEKGKFYNGFAQGNTPKQAWEYWVKLQEVMSNGNS